jgi:hypothetical protein
MPSAKGGVSETARMFCDITLPDGSPSWADPRHVLRRALGKAADMGFTFYTHPEIEFFLLKDLPDDGTPPTPADTGGYFDLSTHNVAHDFRREAVFAWVRTETSGVANTPRVPIPGLDSTATYRVRVREEVGAASRHQVADPAWMAGDLTVTGAVLAQGLPLPVLNPGNALLLHLTPVTS